MDKNKLFENLVDTLSDQMVLISLFQISPEQAMWEVKEKKARVGVPFLKVVRNAYRHNCCSYSIEDVICNADYLTEEVYDFVLAEKGREAADKLFCKIGRFR